jgi:ADP-ribose pyrophosphatase
MRTSNLVRDENGWETQSSETHFANKNLEVVTDTVRTPTRSKPCPWTTVHRKAAVIIAPMTSEGKILLLKQERIPIRAAIWEMPAGQIEGASEVDKKEIEATALRELQEETGYELAPGGELIALGHFFSSPGFTDEHGYFFLARPVLPSTKPEHDETESILECRAFSVAELQRMINENEIRDANTLGMCARLAAAGFLSLAPKK